MNRELIPINDNQVRALLQAGRDNHVVIYDVEAGLSRCRHLVGLGVPLPRWAETTSTVSAKSWFTLSKIIPLTVLLGACCIALAFLGCGVDRLTIGRVDSLGIAGDPNAEADPQKTLPDGGNGRLPVSSYPDSGQSAGAVITRIDPKCGGYTYKAIGHNLNILALYDDSWSTVYKTLSWEPLKAAMKEFITSPQSNGMGMGLRWFSSHGCTADAFATPDVPINTLPKNADTLIKSIDAHQPWGIATQTKYAIEGATEYMHTWAGKHTDAHHIILLVTDGEPEAGLNDEEDDLGNCKLQGGNSDIENTTKAAEETFKGRPSIPVYVLGAGWSLENLHKIAVAGGTEQAFIVDPAQGAQPILDALNAIRSKALPCDYAVPKEYAIYNDPELVNLTHNLNPVGYVESVNQCDPEKGGWYYDNPTDPTRILTCKRTCENLLQGGRVDVVLGCGSVTLY